MSEVLVIPFNDDIFKISCNGSRVVMHNNITESAISIGLSRIEEFLEILIDRMKWTDELDSYFSSIINGIFQLDDNSNGFDIVESKLDKIYRYLTMIVSLKKEGVLV